MNSLCTLDFTSDATSTTKASFPGSSAAIANLPKPIKALASTEFFRERAKHPLERLYNSDITGSEELERHMSMEGDESGNQMTRLVSIHDR